MAALMRTAASVAIAVVALLMMLVVMALAASLALASEGEEPCYVLDLSTITKEAVSGTRESLVSQGWAPRRGDGREALYSPPCDEYAAQAVEPELEAIRDEMVSTNEQVRALRGELDQMRREQQSALSVVYQLVNLWQGLFHQLAGEG